MATRMWIVGLGLIPIAAIVLSIAPKAGASDLGTSITYQGQLKANGVPVTATLPMTFALYDDAVAGTLLGTVGPANVAISAGLFTTELDFGTAAVNGQARWLEINVNGQMLAPRQKLTPAPHAMALPGLYTQQNPTSPNLIGGYSANVIATSAGAAVTGATIGGGGASGIGVNRVTDNYGAIGGGANNRAGDNNNSATNKVYATVAGGRGNIAGGSYSTVGGGQQQSVTADYGTIAGGGPSDPADSTNTNNRVTDNYCTIAGGGNNRAGDGAGTITDRPYATVAGGEGNIAGGAHSSIPGGQFNTAAGSFSLAAGRRAKANHDGALVLADSTDADLASTRPNQLLVRATGGVNLIVDQAGAGLRIQPPSSVPLPSMLLREGNNSVSGHSVNQVSPGIIGATIAGGGVVDDPQAIGGGPFSLPNLVTANGGTVSGGFGNQAGGTAATVGGGTSNVASGATATVSGGSECQALAVGSAVGGGFSNVAEGEYSSVAGGYDNQAGGHYSFAAGRRARVRNLNDTNGLGADHGTFVWADSTDAAFTSTGTDQFLVRAAGGVGINRNDPLPGALDIAGNSFITGNVGVGTRSPSTKLHVVGNICATGTIGACSDARFKSRVTPITNALALVEGLNPVRFDWRIAEYPDRDFSCERQIGMLAQDVRRILPEVVQTGNDGFLAIDYGRLTPVLAEALKELRAEKDSQLAEKSRQIEALNARLERLERSLARHRPSSNGDER